MHNYGVKSEETKMVLFKLFDCNGSKCSTQHKHCLFYVSYLFVQVNGFKTLKKIHLLIIIKTVYLILIFPNKKWYKITECKKMRKFAALLFTI